MVRLVKTTTKTPNKNKKKEKITKKQKTAKKNDCMTKYTLSIGNVYRPIKYYPETTQLEPGKVLGWVNPKNKKKQILHFTLKDKQFLLDTIYYPNKGLQCTIIGINPLETTYEIIILMKKIGRSHKGVISRSSSNTSKSIHEFRHVEPNTGIEVLLSKVDQYPHEQN